MPFKPGNHAEKRRKKRAGGRPTREQKQLEAWTEKIARDYLAKHAPRIMERYAKLAASGKSAATTRHAVDKILPPVEKVMHTGNVIYHTNLPKPKK